MSEWSDIARLWLSMARTTLESVDRFSTALVKSWLTVPEATRLNEVAFVTNRYWQRPHVKYMRAERANSAELVTHTLTASGAELRPAAQNSEVSAVRRTGGYYGDEVLVRDVEVKFTPEVIAPTQERASTAGGGRTCCTAYFVPRARGTEAEWGWYYGRLFVQDETKDGQPVGPERDLGPIRLWKFKNVPDEYGQDFDRPPAASFRPPADI